MIRNFFLALCLVTTRASGAEIERIWLTHKTNEPTHLVVNWETDMPSNSVVEFGPTPECEWRVIQEDAVTRHHVQIALPRPGTYHYRVR